MVTITKATIADSQILSQLATKTFIESHGHSAPAGDIENYVKRKYANDVFKAELENSNNHYHLIFYNNQVAGFSNIIPNLPFEGSDRMNLGKLERIYILENFYNLSFGKQLLGYNMDFAKRQKQSGAWLYVWKENKRAVDFYLRNGFVINGSHDFEISKTHFNPNHRMFLNFK